MELQIDAKSGGRIDLRNVNKISDAAAFGRRRTMVSANGLGSSIDLSSLARFEQNSAFGGWYSTIISSNYATVTLGTATSLFKVDVTVEASSQLLAGTISLDTASYLRGNGDIVANIRNVGGTVIPLASGALVFYGDFVQLQKGVLEVAVNGSSDSGAYSRLQVHGESTLGGDLKIVRQGSFSLVCLLIIR